MFSARGKDIENNFVPALRSRAQFLTTAMLPSKWKLCSRNSAVEISTTKLHFGVNIMKDTCPNGPFVCVNYWKSIRRIEIRISPLRRMSLLGTKCHSSGKMAGCWPICSKWTVKLSLLLKVVFIFTLKVGGQTGGQKYTNLPQYLTFFFRYVSFLWFKRDFSCFHENNLYFCRRINIIYLEETDSTELNDISVIWSIAIISRLAKMPRKQLWPVRNKHTEIIKLVWGFCPEKGGVLRCRILICWLHIPPGVWVRVLIYDGGSIFLGTPPS